MKNLRVKNYQLFNFQERLNLTLAAIARDDKEEMLLLQRSCPKRHYVGADLAYQHRLQALDIINMEFNKWISNYQHKLQITEIGITAFCFLCESPELLEIYQPKFGNVSIVDTLYKLFEAIPKHQSVLKSLSIALVDFCQEIQVDYKNVLTLDKFN